MNFGNKENEKITLLDGRVVWLSRSCAVNSIIIIQVGRWWQKKEFFVLTGIRGKDTPDFQGFRSCPCGYLDWDEDLKGAAFRETWEETDFNLTTILTHHHKYPILDKKGKERWVKIKPIYGTYLEGKPFHVSSHPLANKQNVTCSFGVVLSVPKHEFLPKVSGRNVNKDNYEEVSSVEWTPIHEVIDGRHKFAFNHEIRIMQFFNQFKKSKFFF